MTRIDFLDDLTVTVAVTVDGRGLAGVVHRAVADDQPPLAAEADRGHQWPAVEAAVERSVRLPVVGTASAPAVPAEGTDLPAVVLDLRPPTGFDGLLTAEGIGRSGNRLKAKGLADAAAVADLRRQLLALPVRPGQTLAAAADRDPQLAAAVSRVLLDVRDDRIDYRADGTCHVRAHLDLPDAWDRLRGGR